MDTNTNSLEPLRCHSLIVPWMTCHRKTRTTTMPLKDPQPTLQKYNDKISSDAGCFNNLPPPSSCSHLCTFTTVRCHKCLLLHKQEVASCVCSYSCGSLGSRGAGLCTRLYKVTVRGREPTKTGEDIVITRIRVPTIFCSRHNIKAWI